ncbi:protein ALTERED XYLOGLUCAN 4-like [Panicum miliaceum]|uniref:Protein ALTERED XYLOGLUCAN 4-like n=1 Tax=Panicum miliaceum TaxID=4540 RepID=A0A3L6S196_PANMI|nr:protein ALTERED XYLOGLUCAN 4-like [Panicum miliaceum]
MGACQQPLHPHSGQKPSSSSPSSASPGYFLPRTTGAWLACGFLSLALLHLLCCSPPGTQQAVFSPLLQYFNGTYSSVSSAPGEGGPSPSCDYSEGRWVWAPGHARRYNATACGVKDSEDCVRNGRPDTGYLDWRWQPAGGCPLPAFDAAAFLTAVRGRHVAFVGDSMARNQAESLVCLLGASAFPPRLVHRDADPGEFRFRRWAFPSHGVTVSVYWAPFLARATGRVDDYHLPYSSVHLDALAERWSAEAGTMDVAVLSAGHWFLKWAVFYNGSEVLGAHMLPDLNHTEIGFASPFREVIRKSLERLLGSGGGGGRTVVLATISPSHFEKAWDDPTTCARKAPYKDGENEVDGEAAELRRVVKEEASAAAWDGGAATIKVLDVTKLATMRPDGHPGAYMHRDPFGPGKPEKMLNDCLHSCLPGPVDTFNEILLQLLLTKR